MARWILFGVALFAGLVPTAIGRADVTVSAAISLVPALTKAQPILEQAAGDKITFNFGASGTLAGQIRQGSPVDLFISADRATAARLVEAGAADKDTQRLIAGNELVLIVPGKPDLRTSPAGFADLTRVRRLAIGEPRVVPAGAYAKELLTHLKLWDDLDKSNKLVTAENVAQVLVFVTRGEVDAGIVYVTDAKAAGQRNGGGGGVTVVATADASMHGPIEYLSVVVSDSKHRDVALKVQQTLLGPNVQDIFKSFGLTPAESTPSPSATQPAQLLDPPAQSMGK